ncbi:primosomal protein N' [candidate division KSB1 bacterium]|nr:primosomal protein N' [candidate division KSB1 bacterium]
MGKSENEILLADVVFPVPVQHAYTYLVPEKFNDDVVPGVRVLAPFGPRKVTGFVIGRKDKSDYPDLKAIEEVLDPVPLFTPEVLELARWIADYYLCGWGEVLKAALPAGIHLNSERVLRLVHENPIELAESLKSRSPRQAEIIGRLALNNPMTLNKLKNQMSVGSFYSSLKKLRQEGYVRVELSLPRAKVGKKYETIIKIPEKYTHDEMESFILDLEGKAPKQAKSLEILLRANNREFTRMGLAKQAGTNLSSVNSLVDKGYIELETREIFRDYYNQAKYELPKKLFLNTDQQNALNKIKAGLDVHEAATFLLHGVTGSGKTQVYIEAIYHVISKGQTAIVLVPEIALTPQMVSRFRAHFGDLVAVFHSRMSPGERYDSWRQTWEGKHKIVIGPRSAIFAPLKKVGLIVIDEEHEPSFKQSDLTPRYNARDVAVVRAILEKAVVVLGSATPSVESYFNTQIEKYRLLELPKRIDDVPMPKVELVDMKREPKIIGRKSPVIFSRLLRQKIDEKLSLGEQIILFLNRRGFATLFKCKDCGYTAKCDHCDITLTYHIKGHILKCHYCGYTRRAPDRCPECGGTDVMFRGVGTQRVEEELNELYPGVKAIRMDLDTTRGRMAHDRLLDKFGSGEYQVLLGTQMVAKGLDFPNVTLVGVISADTELFLPDFRAAERTFQLITQVAGRAGRKDKTGEVIVQSYDPGHYSLKYARNHNFQDFFRSELFDRHGQVYPPYSRIINILFRGKEEAVVRKAAENFAQMVKKDPCFEMLGPVPSTLSKIQNFYRWHILFKSVKKSDSGSRILKNSIRESLAEYKKKHKSKNVTLTIDVDPGSIL